MSEPKARRTVVVSSSLQRHQVSEYLLHGGFTFGQRKFDGYGSYEFTFSASDEQWDRIQAWVKKVTG